MEKHMKRCFELAKRGKGNVLSNPLVGCVIVKNGRVLSEGYHHIYGGKHAEVNAIENATESVKGSTLYCNLEPCFHTGKQPPCVDRIINEGISEVIISNIDPNPLVANKSIEKLRRNNIKVTLGVFEEEGKRLNESFFKYITSKTPFVTMKIAMTMDGKIALENGESKWITSQESRNHSHQIRNQNMGLLVGVNTILNDNPKLTTRINNGKDPDIFILDSSLKTPLNANVFKANRKVFIFTSVNEKTFIDKGIILLQLSSLNNKISMKEAINKIGELGYKNILIESGGEINFSALEAKVVDKIHIYIAPKIFGGKGSVSAVSGIGIKSINDAFTLHNKTVEMIGEDILITGYIGENNVHGNN